MSSFGHFLARIRRRLRAARRSHRTSVSFSHSSPLLYTASNAVSSPPVPSKLREWWHQILREHGRYKCYAVFLALPSDEELAYYLLRSGKEIDLISGEDCLVLVFSALRFVHVGPNQNVWRLSVSEHVDKGYSVRLAEIPNIRLDEFPCLVLFRDVRSPEHVTIDLRGLTVDDIIRSMRVVFSVVQVAALNQQDPLAAVESYRDNQRFIHNGKTIIGKVGKFAGKTVEAIMEAYIEAYAKAGVK